MKGKRKYRWILGAVLAVTLAALFVAVRQEKAQESVIPVGMEKIQKAETEEITAGKFSGMEQETREAMVSGLPVGIYVKTRGLLILGCEPLITTQGERLSPGEGLLLPGDILLEAQGELLTSKNQFRHMVEEGNGALLKLLVEREGVTRKVSLQPLMTKEGLWKCGIWIRNDTCGIGTLTCVVGDRFVALGHGITDQDTGTLFQVEEGDIYPLTLTGILPSKPGNPGELLGYLIGREEESLGSIAKNQGEGICGEAKQGAEEGGMLCPVAAPQEIHCGKATLRSGLSGEMREYTLEILALHPWDGEKEKGLEFQVTDPGLLELTGGIVQGMSGSPILQDGKLIGAVTHVLVKDPTRGYGIYIREMLP